jgi:hypothetical protein
MYQIQVHRVQRAAFITNPARGWGCRVQAAARGTCRRLRIETSTASPRAKYYRLMRGIGQPQPVGVGGWLVILCGVLLVWQPLNLAVSAASVLDALAFRGLPVALVLGARLLVAALGIAAGLALLSRRSGAVFLAKTAVIASAATDAFVYSTPYYPSNRLPGDTIWYIAASLAYHGVLLGYLFQSARVRNTY